MQNVLRGNLERSEECVRQRKQANEDTGSVE